MLTYKEIFDLRVKLSIGEITLENAKESYWKDYKVGKRSWHTKDWEERRNLVIKENCEICTSKEKLTLQHFSHPKKYFEFEREITRKYSQNFNDEIDFFDKERLREYISKKYTYEPVPLCPKCEKRKPNKRTTKAPQYFCTNCREEFDEPIHKSTEELIDLFYENELSLLVRDKCFVTNDGWNNKHNFKYMKYLMNRDLVKTTNFELIEKEAFLLYLDDSIKYLSFSDTITACKKCAFFYDLHNMDLCPNCKKYYKGVQYSTCIQCLPDIDRIAALEKIEFGKHMRSIDEGLDIQNSDDIV